MEIEQLYKEIIENEPVKAKEYKGLVMETNEHIGWRQHKEELDSVLKIPKEKRQKILDRFKQGGISIKETAREFKEEIDSVSSLVFLNINKMCKERELKNDKI